ncbi:hypothetical protein [Botrimarina hoheduenensis]|uniref:Peptidase M10 metallopeptidase domain-containing protein n=1 Tax=Botrimarina hoheduenensis TaxID=2528000 RepID=A0A5C5WA59_9BACT|nr:hypothetical protein [Botrimarina hoheduenensis]TWT47768.1 hypothetical protein Pla111_13890 [Botrimarina hoheduenensis]
MSRSPRPAASRANRFGVCLTLLSLSVPVSPAAAIELVLDYTLDENNANWFGVSPEGIARRATLDAAADFLSAIITNEDWSALPSLNRSFGLTDLFASSIIGLDGQPIAGFAESDGRGYEYSIPTSNRSAVGANQYVVYVGAFAFDTATTARAKGGWNDADRRNPAGFAGVEFNTWGGRIYFDLSENWYWGQNPGPNPTDNYGVQDPNKMPLVDITTDNWDYSTVSDSWKGFDLRTIDAGAASKGDLYGTALHELLHALGATTSNFTDYVGLSPQGDLLGPNVVAVHGGPVPAAGGHFAENLQSFVWDSQGIVSEALLDPNSLSGVRKYLTEIDVALLRDLGYEVLPNFAAEPLAADFNLDAVVDLADYTIWRDSYGSTEQLAADADGSGTVDEADYLVWVAEYGRQAPPTAMSFATPEPASLMIAAVGALSLRQRRGFYRR